MHIHVKTTREPLLQAIQAATATVQRNAAVSTLTHILIEHDASVGLVRITGSDLQTQITAEAAIAPGGVSGSTTVSAHKLLDIVRLLGPGAEISLLASASDRLIITSGKSRYHLQTQAAENFPSFAHDTEAARLTLPASALFHALRRVRFAAGTNDVRYCLNGVAIRMEEGIITTIGSDGHRLALCRTPLDSSPKFDEGTESLRVIPIKAADEIIKLLGNALKGGADQSVKFSLGSRACSVKVERVNNATVMISSKLIDGVYPDVERVIPKKFTSGVGITADAISGALSRVMALLDKPDVPIRLAFSGEMLTLQSTNSSGETSEDTLPIDYHDGTYEGGYNGRYLLDAITHCGAYQASIDFDERGALITGTGEDGWLSVVMGMRL